MYRRQSFPINDRARERAREMTGSLETLIRGERGPDVGSFFFFFFFESKKPFLTL